MCKPENVSNYNNNKKVKIASLTSEMSEEYLSFFFDSTFMGGNKRTIHV